MRRVPQKMHLLKSLLLLYRGLASGAPPIQLHEIKYRFVICIGVILKEGLAGHWYDNDKDIKMCIFAAHALA